MTPGAEDLAPIKAHHDDAAYDLKSRVAITLAPGARQLVPSGLFLELPFGFEAQVRPRSGLALKKGITVLNSPGTIDAGYRGEVGIILLNTADVEFVIQRGDRVAQMVIQKLPEVELVLASELQDSHRGDNGFGSTGHQ
jgi:dUTP pyrophosphatase